MLDCVCACNEVAKGRPAMRVSCPRCSLATHPRYSSMQVRPHQWQRALPHVSAIDHALLPCTVLHFLHVWMHGWLDSLSTELSESGCTPRKLNPLQHWRSSWRTHCSESHAQSWLATIMACLCQRCLPSLRPGLTERHPQYGYASSHRAAHSCTAWWTACRCASCRATVLLSRFPRRHTRCRRSALPCLSSAASK